MRFALTPNRSRGMTKLRMSALGLGAAARTRSWTLFGALVAVVGLACGDDDVAPGAPSFPGAEGGIPPLNLDGSVAEANVALEDAPGPGPHLVDEEGRTLYVFVNDVPFSETSACGMTCVIDWPVFDRISLTPGDGLNRADFDRFQRVDGSSQTTYRGRPLHYYSGDSAANPRAGDGLDNRWFAARDYFVLAAASPGITPLGDTAADGDPFLTDRAGRAAYVFANDMPGAPPTTACTDSCLQTWPVWQAESDLGNVILPAGLDLADFGGFARTVDGATVRQLTYRQWPLYFFSEDDQPGEIAGHAVPNWSVIDPRTFAPGRAAGGTE